MWLALLVKKTNYFSAQSVGTPSTKFVDKQILEHKTMIISIMLMSYRLFYLPKRSQWYARLPGTLIVLNKTTLDCTVAKCTDCLYSILRC